jgi:hypothetical protein
MTDNDAGRLRATLEEYMALRAEATGTVERQYAVMYWGISGVSLLVAAMINAWDKLVAVPALPIFLLYFVIPALCTAYLLAWSHIILKLVKIGSHLFVIEEKVAACLEPAREFSRTTPVLMPMSWEHYVNEPGAYGYLKTCGVVKWAIAGAYLVCSVAGTTLTVWSYWHKLAHGPRAMVTAAIGLVFLGWSLTWFYLFRWIVEHIQIAVEHRDSFHKTIADSPV